MSLLSRFRDTVLPSSSRKKKLVDDNVRNYNYRKPTKSFNEKSVKSKKSTNHHQSNAKEQNVPSNCKLLGTSASKSAVQQSANKNETNNHSSANNATLSRSNTFTLDQEEQFRDGTHSKFKRKDKYSDGKKYDYRQSVLNNDKENNVNKDVFETFYSKRASRSSHSSKSSNDSIRGADDATPTLNKPNPYSINNYPAYEPAKIYRYDSPAKISLNFGNEKLSSNRSEKSKPREYLFGSTFNQTNKNEPDKGNIYTNADPTNSDRFKTITINNLRRSFRESFLDSTKPAKGREHQQLWFIDANDDKRKSEQFETNENSFKQPTKFIDNTTDPYGIRHPIKVKRNETFRVDNDSRPTKVLSHRETFRINREQSPVRARERLRTPSVDSKNSHSLTTNKVIPVAVTPPYNSLNDIDDNNRSATITRKNQFTPENYNYKHFDENENDGNVNKHSLQEFSPLRRDKNIEYKSEDIPSYNYAATRNQFDKRSIPERQSFHDSNNDTFNRPRAAHRSYASLRSKLEETGSSLPRKQTSNNCNEVDGSSNILAKPCYMYSNKPTEAWRQISTRQFNNNDSDTGNRSFVPYRNKSDTYERPKSNNNYNRTTININYNYNNMDNAAPSKKKPSPEIKPNNEYDMPTLVNKSTSAIKSNSGKDKSNKNRSVNFPSVECEVRLISPNYDTKPRRKESWKSKPSNDWTFNKAIIIKEVVNGTKCTECKNLCPGFEPHSWRKTCLACKCPRETHAIYQEQLTSVRERLGLKPLKNISKLDAQQLGYTWIPPGIMTTNKIRQYFESLPDGKVPKINKNGEEYRAKQISYQWPKQDLALNYCKHIEPQNNGSYEDFVAGRNEISLDAAHIEDVAEPSICANCDENVKPGDLVVIAPRFNRQMLWHPKCFTCSTCDELLVDLFYCIYDDKIYCERHYAELFKPRCYSCDELIFSGEYTKAMNKDWHSGHFCCWQCDESLTGQRYVLRDDHPYCIKCYENVFANTCDECNKIIGIDSKDLSYKEKHWHEACFLCNKCRVSLVDKQFGSKAEKIYCGNCYDSQFASRCDGCGDVFRAGTKKMEYKTRQWHEKCFACCVCKNPIGTKSFIPREQEIYCAGCYEEKYATRCIKCSKIIASGGVTYKNDPWHRECFTCTHCSTSLAGQRFTSRDDNPYCADCFGELFAKRCTACTKPITGIGGTRFISFEDRHWHNDCFICASCKTSLVGRGFITDEADIICPECAKAKLL